MQHGDHIMLKFIGLCNGPDKRILNHFQLIRISLSEVNEKWILFYSSQSLLETKSLARGIKTVWSKRALILAVLFSLSWYTQCPKMVRIWYGGVKHHTQTACKIRCGWQATHLTWRKPINFVEFVAWVQKKKLILGDSGEVYYWPYLKTEHRQIVAGQE